jgi:hypothetical protein
MTYLTNKQAIIDARRAIPNLACLLNLANKPHFPLPSNPFLPHSSSHTLYPTTLDFKFIQLCICFFPLLLTTSLSRPNRRRSASGRPVSRVPRPVSHADG